MVKQQALLCKCTPLQAKHFLSQGQAFGHHDKSRTCDPHKVACDTVSKNRAGPTMVLLAGPMVSSGYYQTIKNYGAFFPINRQP